MTGPGASPPRAAVTVDQLRFDYLTRFAHERDSGLARLRRDGASFINARSRALPDRHGTRSRHAPLRRDAATSGIIGTIGSTGTPERPLPASRTSRSSRFDGTAATSASPAPAPGNHDSGRAQAHISWARGEGAPANHRHLVEGSLGHSARGSLGGRGFWYDSGTGELRRPAAYLHGHAAAGSGALRVPEGALRCPCRCCCSDAP